MTTLPTLPKQSNRQESLKILQDVRQIVNAFSRVVTALKTAISPFIFSGYRRMPLAEFPLERVIIRAFMIVSLCAVAAVQPSRQ